jgi:hypothetical protein
VPALPECAQVAELVAQHAGIAEVPATTNGA